MTAGPSLSVQDLAQVRLHIRQTWDTLTRSPAYIRLALADPKWARAGGWAPLYVSEHESFAGVRMLLDRAFADNALTHLDLRVLPADPRTITDHGLLYLPGRYVVPGGRFNELYGWDAYFIVLGLLREGRTSLAVSMADQLLYSVEHYGTVPAANRTYYLTRSQPPLLSRIVLAVFERTRDLEWLRKAVPLVEKYCGIWSVPPHSIPHIHLSRYHGTNEGPCAEVIASERDSHGKTHYERLAAELALHRDEPGMKRYLDQATGALTAEAYQGDRALRESGFDITGRFGIGGVEAADHVPVCLNTLLWRMERDLSKILKRLGKTAEASGWEQRAASRAADFHELLWDERAHIYFDYHIRKGQRTLYPFATAFWPLWAGLATNEQARILVEKWLPRFQTAGGLLTSLEHSGCQWDYPMAWAPLVLMAVTGLERYGSGEPARQIAASFVSMVCGEFSRTGNLFEKYDAVKTSSEVEHHIRFGYSSNQAGFGWTNGCVLELLHFLRSG